MDLAKITVSEITSNAGHGEGFTVTNRQKINAVFSMDLQAMTKLFKTGIHAPEPDGSSLGLLGLGG